MITINVDKLAAAIAEKLELERAGSPWLRILEAAEYMHVSERWIREHIGEIPHVRVDGRRLLFNRRELDDWLRRQRA
jgi:excisionase family DNA binding protein